MHGFRSRRWSALTVLFIFASQAARAGMITPDSIPNPPSSVASAQGTPVYTNNFVIGQYSGLGLVFPRGSALTQLNGMSVWAPVSPPPKLAGPSSSGSASGSIGSIAYAWSLLGRFVLPGSLNPTAVSSLTVGTLGNPSLSMSVYGLNGQRLNIIPVIGSIAGVHDWTFTGRGISSFFATVVPPPGGGAHPGAITNPAWGVAGVSFTPVSGPEPSSLVLAGLGALGLVTRLGWRRSWRVA
jgi:hypothetical protein